MKKLICIYNIYRINMEINKHFASILMSNANQNRYFPGTYTKYTITFLELEKEIMLNAYYRAPHSII